MIWRLFLGVILIMSAGGCSSVFGNDKEENYAAAGVNGPVLSLHIGVTELTGNTDKPLSAAYRKGMTIRELLRASGLVSFTADGKSIGTVNEVSLGDGMQWELQVDGKVENEGDWDSTIHQEAHLVIGVKRGTAGTPLPSVIMVVNGGSRQSELNHSYIMPFTEELSVRNLLAGCGMVRLSEDKRSVLTVKDYTPLTSEAWMLKVNGKQLLDSGMDMKLRPEDEVELSLVTR
jgi:hypothetical protein